MEVLIAIPLAMIFIVFCAGVAYVAGLFGIGILALIEKFGYPIVVPVHILFACLVVYVIIRICRWRKVVLAERAKEREERWRSF